MDIRYLRHFLALADELHFGRAAARLNMAQAPLSQSIRRLETHLGARLFDRSPQGGTRLTDAGRRLLPEAMAAVRAFEAAMQAARPPGGAAHPPLRLGFVTLSLPDRLPRAVRAFETAHPGRIVSLQEGSSAALLEGMAAGRLDLAVIHPTAAAPPALRLLPIRRERMVAALPGDHPLGTRRSIALRDLAGDALIFFPRSASPDLHDALLPVLRGAGLAGRIRQEVRTTSTMLLLVAAGLGCALVAESARRLPVSGVAFVELSDLDPGLEWGLDLALPPGEGSPAIRALAQLLVA